MESRGRKEAGVVHSVEAAGRNRDKGESRVTFVCLRDAESSKGTVSDQFFGQFDCDECRCRDGKV